MALIKGYTKERKRTITSLIITVLIIFLLIFSGPASAIQVTLSGLSDITEGGDLTFDVEVRLENTRERVPIQNITVWITNSSNPSQSWQYVISADGTNITDGISATRTGALDYGYGDLYGYGYGYNADTQTYGYGYLYGYGYGYGYQGTSYAYSYRITISSSSSVATLGPGTYYIRAKVMTGNETITSFVSSQQSFTVYATTAGDVTGPTIDITFPPAGAKISKLNNTVTGSVTDSSGIYNVTLKVGNTLYASWTSSGTFSKKVNYTTGLNTINITAWDASSNRNRREVLRTVNVTESRKEVVQTATSGANTTVDATAEASTHITFVTNSTFTANVTVTGATDVSGVNVSEDLTSAYGLGQNQQSMTKFISIETNVNASNVSWVLLKFYYTDADLDRNGDGDANDPGDLNENALHLYWYCTNTSLCPGAQRWFPLTTGTGLVAKGGPIVYATGTNKDENYLWSNQSKFSVYGMAGDIISAPAVAEAPVGAIGVTPVVPPEKEVSAVLPSQITVGESVELKVTVKNTRSVQEPYKISFPDLPSGWTITGDTLVTIPAKGEKVVTYTLSVPSTASLGTYTFTIKVEGINWYHVVEESAGIEVIAVVPVVTTAPPVVTTVPPVVTTAPPVTAPPVVTTVPPVVTTAPPIVTTAPPVVTTAPPTTAPPVTTAPPKPPRKRFIVCGPTAILILLLIPVLVYSLVEKRKIRF